MTVDRMPDPANLTKSDRPAVVDVEGQGNVYVAAAKVRDNGWLWLKYWDGGQAKLPPHRVLAVEHIETERYGEADEMGFKKQRVVDKDWRDRARAMRADDDPEPEFEPAQPSVGDD